jgi:hypothetical protein
MTFTVDGYRIIYTNELSAGKLGFSLLILSSDTQRYSILHWLYLEECVTGFD